jgi:hypothetical protein
MHIDFIFVSERCRTGGNLLQLVEVYKACVITWKELWIWCSAFYNSITDGDDKQQPGHSSMSIADDGVSSGALM